MLSVRVLHVVAGAVLLAGCGGPGVDAPTDASIEDFCAAKTWMVVEGMDRFFASGLPSDDELVVLVHDWAAELARVGTPDNMSPAARSGFEKLVARLEEMEAGDVEEGSFNWEDGDWENDEEQSFARYVTNTCP
jgi:hypothetical protein